MRGHKRVSPYAIATPVQEWPHPATACLISEASDPYLYIRDTPDGRIMCGGEDEEISDSSERDALLPAKAKAISAKLGALLPGINATADFAWAGTFGESATGL